MMVVVRYVFFINNLINGESVMINYNYSRVVPGQVMIDACCV